MPEPRALPRTLAIGRMATNPPKCADLLSVNSCLFRPEIGGSQLPRDYRGRWPYGAPYRIKLRTHILLKLQYKFKMTRFLTIRGRRQSS